VLSDDELALVFLCCHPSLPPDAAVALTLRTAGGLATREIASAFLVPEATVAQRIVRAKRALGRLDALEIPGTHELPARREAVLRALYLLFNEGYAATEGDPLVRRELCAEAIRMASLLASHPSTLDPEVDALLALLLLNASRLPARTDDRGDLLLLAEQDRTRWDRELLGRGLAHLERAGRGERLTAYHLEAGIAACHAMAPSFEETDWRSVVALYDLLAGHAPSAVVSLNRTVAVAMLRGPSAGLEALEASANDRGLARGHLLPSVRGWLLGRAGETSAAAAAYRQAAARTRSDPVRRHLTAKAAELEAMPRGGPRA
jgi:predicted RNA polymerase sigma factor